MERLIFRKPTWKTGLAAILMLAVIVCLAVLIPPLGRSNEALARDIAVNDPEVLAILEEYEFDPEDIDESDILYIDGFAKLIVETESGCWIIVDIDTGEKEVMAIQVQEFTDITEQDITNIAKTDSRVLELLDKGAQIMDIELSYNYPASIEVFKQSLDMIGVKIDAEEMVGLLANLELSLGDESYFVFVNATMERVIFIFEPDSIQIDYSSTIVTVTETLMR